MKYWILYDNFVLVAFCTKENLAAEFSATQVAKNYPRESHQAWVDKFIALYIRNQWKRERLAPSFHLEVDSACPKTYRRYPILS
jgi:hypothetical protein